MRMLAAPVKGDAPITSGESGAAPFGALAAMMTMDEYKDLRNDIGWMKTPKYCSSLQRAIPILIVTKTLYEKALINNYKQEIHV